MRADRLMTETRCPNPSCRTVFSIEPRSLGRTVSCPTCARSLTARPLDIWKLLDERERQLAAGDTSAIERENERQRASARAPAKLRYHESPEAALRGAALAHDPMYESGIDRDAALAARPCELVALLDDI